MSTISVQNVLVIKTESKEIRIPFSTLQLSVETQSMIERATVNPIECEKTKAPIVSDMPPGIIKRFHRLGCNSSLPDQYPNQLKELTEKGFTNEKLNMMILALNKGNLAKSIKQLTRISNRQSNLAKKKSPTYKKQKTSQTYEEELNQLDEQGFHHTKLNIRLLAKNNGNLTATIADIKKVATCRVAKRANRANRRARNASNPKP